MQAVVKGGVSTIIEIKETMSNCQPKSHFTTTSSSVSSHIDLCTYKQYPPQHFTVHAVTLYACMYIQVADENCLYYHNHWWPSWPYPGELGTEKGYHTHAKAQVGKKKAATYS